ncbi:MAG: dTDP-glucose 4,6-dehydratase [Candidatus Diapherotrites archaeon]|nr:dTDP-glucose 4,6-dehydratase [Candidatus Micrarchaeota archaeon]MBU1939965.1 dTDP-glucose 4,6-dehydratase [Candidatus Micrarchaeota archaeon]
MAFQKVLVTGGAGFIGSNFVHYFLREHPQSELVNLDKLTYAGNKANLAGLEGNKNYSFVQADICDAAAVGKAMEGCDAIVNFAAESHVDRSIKDASTFLRTNVEGVRVLLEAAGSAGVKRFMQISTDEVYGSIAEGSFKETDALSPRNPYSASKAAADLLVNSYAETYGLGTVITRSSNNFGPYQFPEKVIPLFVTNLLRGKKVPLYGDGMNVREWIYVEDNCRGIETVFAKGKKGETYNVGSGDEKTNIDLTKAILAELGKGDDMIERVQDRLGHDRRYSLDCTKLRALGWEPTGNFGENLKRTVSWYKGNEKWWEPLLEGMK